MVDSEAMAASRQARKEDQASPREIIQTLSAEFELAYAEVEKIYQGELSGSARVRTFLPLLAAKRAKRVLPSIKRSKAS